MNNIDKLTSDIEKIKAQPSDDEVYDSIAKQLKGVYDDLKKITVEQTVQHLIISSIIQTFPSDLSRDIAIKVKEKLDRSDNAELHAMSISCFNQIFKLKS